MCIRDRELAGREFMPEIRKLASVSTFATPSVWQVETDRGATRFTLRGEEDIRRLSPQTLLIADSHGIFYLAVSYTHLDVYKRQRWHWSWYSNTSSKSPPRISV